MPLFSCLQNSRMNYSSRFPVVIFGQAIILIASKVDTDSWVPGNVLNALN